MHISRVSLVNYRNFSSCSITLHAGVNTIIGENGSGKTNLFRAIRLLLDEDLLGRRNSLAETDFHRGIKDWRGHWISISLEFAEIGQDESMQALFQHRTADDNSDTLERATYGLLFRPNRQIRDELAKIPHGDVAALKAIQQKIVIDDYETVFVGKGTVDLTDPSSYRRVVGDFENAIFPSDNRGLAPDCPDLGVTTPRYFSLAKEFSFSYIPALRDVVRDFQMNRNNPLQTLLNVKSEEIEPGDFDEIIAQVENLNASIEGREDVMDIRDAIRTTFKQTVGETYSPTSLSIKSELPLEAGRLFQSLKLYVGEHGETYEGGLSELSLGGANLVFLTLKLLEFQYRSARKAIANFLIIEEPEAHIHTHIQKTLFDRVEYANTQIIYSTHSTHISEVSKVARVNVLAREGAGWRAYQPSNGLDPKDIRGAQRFLDAIRSNLLFARSVLLVEGDAEEILVPNLIKEVYGVSADEIGLSLINVRSTGFRTLANFFHEDRIGKYCSIATDEDTIYFSTDEDDADADTLKAMKAKARGSAKAGMERKAFLNDYTEDNKYVEAFYARHTFEVDFALASKENREILCGVVDDVYAQKGKRKEFKDNLRTNEIHIFGVAALSLAEKAGKGWFAIALAEQLSHVATVPQYIIDALAFTVRTLPVETWSRIFQHRLLSSDVDWSTVPFELEDAESVLDSFQSGEIDLADANSRLQVMNDDPQMNSLVEAFLR